jgi:hypothetical protein
MTQHSSKTWELCGSLEIPRLEAQYIVGQNEQGQVITNYAEHVDEVLNSANSKKVAGNTQHLIEY